MNLAFEMRPQTLDAFVGQEHLVGKGKPIRLMIESGTLFPCMFWGPPGVGKTTLAHIMAKAASADFYDLSGVTSGKKDLLDIVEKARVNKSYGKKTVLFIDEIHRWNKAQQDALLPHVESGLIILIGATTENPSFEIIAALLSRSRIFVLHHLSLDNLLTLVSQGLKKLHAKIDPEAQKLLLLLSGGDARMMLSALELSAIQHPKKIISKEMIEEAFQKKGSIYDNGGEEHYNTISAFIKSMRGSDPNASLYYLARMIEAGEEPTFIARRMIIFASEDIGLADRGALIQANEAYEAVEKIGYPEAQLTLAHCALYLALAKKSRSVADSLSRAFDLVRNYPNEPIPLHLRNAPTKLMKDLGYGQNQGKKPFLPDTMSNKKLYIP